MTETDAVDYSDGVVTLSDGRHLAWTSRGEGPTVVWCHGSMGGRLDISYVRPGRHQARVVAFDRPGQGRSTRAERSCLADAAGDVAQLADALGIDRFSVVGYSMGGPYALAVGAKLPDRVEAVGVVAGVPPLDEEGLAAIPGPAALFHLARAHGAAALAASMEEQLYPVTPERVDAFLAQFEGGVDGEYLRANPQARAAVIASAIDSAQQGAGGWADDHVAIAARWGIDWCAYRPPVLIFQGEEDQLVTPAAAELIARRISGAVVRPARRRGHYAWITSMSDVLDAVLDAGPLSR